MTRLGRFYLLAASMCIAQVPILAALHFAADLSLVLWVIAAVVAGGVSMALWLVAHNAL